MYSQRVEGPIVELSCVFCGYTEYIRLIRWYRPWPPVDLDDYFYFRERAFDELPKYEHAAICKTCMRVGLSLDMFGAENVVSIPICAEGDSGHQIPEAN